MPDSFGKNPFQNISYDELSYKNALILSNNSPSIEARNESLIRQSQAEILHRYKADKYNIEGVQIWQAFRDYPRPPNYFEIIDFGAANPPYKKRQVEEERWIFESDYQPWVEAQGVEMEMIPLSSKKVASVAINLFLQNKEISSFHQANLLNKSVNLSVREKKILTEFNQQVNSYYDEYTEDLIAEIKESGEKLTLQEARGSNNQLVLVESDQHILLISRNRIFSPTLFSIQSATKLRDNISNHFITEWLDTYLEGKYSFYTIDNELLTNNFPELEINIISDENFLKQKLLNLSKKTIRDLFLYNNELIEINDFIPEYDFLNKLTTESELFSFRSENFQTVFFDLNNEEKNGLQNLVKQFVFKTPRHQSLNIQENIFYEKYSQWILDLIRNADVLKITPVDLFQITSKSYEHVESVTTSFFSIDELHELIQTLEDLTQKFKKSSSLYWKTSLQLSIFLLPGAIRSLNKGDPMELTLPLGQIAADVALRRLCFNLIHHPKTQSLMQGQFSQKLLTLIDSNLERIPIVGGPLALYGVIKSAKALATMAPNDPQKVYHAHLLINHSLTLLVMGIEIAEKLSYWPCLALYTCLTLHQVMSEGELLHQTFHLHDDENNYKLLYFRKFKLGLGFVDIDIKTIIQQQKIFQTFLAYLSKLNLQANYITHIYFFQCRLSML